MSNSHFKKSKTVIKTVAIATFLILGTLTIDAISETNNWQWFNIDFNEKDHIISAYGSLIGGVLAFLSILFVIFQILEQREEMLQSKIEKDKEDKDNLFSRLKMIATFLETILSNVESHGSRMKKYSKEEKKSPSKMNTIKFTSFKNFGRIIEMDVLTNYKSLQVFLSNEKWEKLFVNLYNLIDFYGEALNDFKIKFNSHVKYKFDEQNKVLDNISLFFGDRLIDDYLKKYGKKEYLKKPWSFLFNVTVLEYHKYLKHCEKNKELHDLRHISDEILLPFLKEAMNLRDDIGYDEFESDELVRLASKIRKGVNRVEVQSLHYAEDVKINYDEYFSPDNKHVNELKSIMDKINNKVNEN